MSVKTQAITLLASAARIATPNAVVFEGRGDIINLHLVIDVTAVVATPSVQVAIEALDPASGDYYSLLSGIAAITAISTTVLKIGRDVESVTNLAKQDFIPETFRITFTHADADSITYSVGANIEVL